MVGVQQGETCADEETMSKRDAKRRACAIVAHLLAEAKMQQADLVELEADDQLIHRAIDELIVELDRRGQGCAPGA